NDELEPDLIAYNTLMKAYAAGQAGSAARGLLLEMECCRVSPDVVSYCAAMKASAAHEVPGLFAQLGERQLQADLITFSTLISALARRGRGREAEETLAAMRRSMLVPDAVCYTPVLDLYARRGEVAKLQTLLAQIEGNIVSYTVLMKALVKAERLEEARETLAQMSEKQLEPNLVSYTSLLSAFAKKGQTEEATTLVESMRANELQMDVVSYGALLSAFAAARDAQGALDTLQQCRQERIAPNLICYATALRAVKAAGDRKQLEMLLAEMTQSRPRERERGSKPEFRRRTEVRWCDGEAEMGRNPVADSPRPFGAVTASKINETCSCRDGPKAHGLLQCPLQLWVAMELAVAKKKDASELEDILHGIRHRSGLFISFFVTRDMERSVAKYFVRLIYATGDGDNIFTPKYLHLIREIERRVQRLPSFHRFCLAGDRGRCQPPLSVINYFFATVNGATGAMVPDGQGSKLLPIQSILASLGTSNSYFVDRYFGVSQSQLQAALEGNITRSVLRFGLPLRGFSNLQDHQQFELFSQFVRDELRPTLVEATSEELKVFFYGDAITQVEVEATVWHDAAYATGSLAFIFLYLVFYL
ncbi:Pentatricopeptide repeat-containing protein At1g62914, partial [Durusdinium trenchii]